MNPTSGQQNQFRQDAIRIHRITDDMVKKAPLWPTIWPEIRSILTENHSAIYNAEYDLARDALLAEALQHHLDKSISDILHHEIVCKVSRRLESSISILIDFIHLKMPAGSAGYRSRIRIVPRDDSLLARELLRYMANANP